MPQWSANSIYLVSDDLERSRKIIDFLGWKFPVSPVDLYAVQKLGEIDSGICVFDTDLSNHDNVPHIRLLKRAFNSCHKYFVVDDDKYANLVQANALGASGVLRKSKLQSDAIHLLQSIRKELMRDIWRNLAEGMQETLTGLNSLNDNITDAVARGSALPGSQVVESCDRIITSLGEQSLSSILEAVRQHHSYTYRHSMIVSTLATSFALTLGMRRSDVERMSIGALMHDVGKMKLPLGILDKPGKLNDAERELVNKHPEFGAEILSRDGQFSPEVVEIALRHHELLDGSGYPDGLTGDRISDPVRIMTVVDIFAALIDERSYKDSMPADEAYELLVRMDGQLDQDIVRAFESTAANAESERALRDVNAV